MRMEGKIDCWQLCNIFYYQNYIYRRMMTRLGKTRQENRSVLESQNQFTGWQEDQGTQMGDNILKQFKRNLNNYEKNYHDLARDTHKFKRRSKSLLKESISQKENFMKLPSLNSMHPNPNKDYSAFLESQFTKNGAKIQLSSALHSKENKPPKVVVYIEEPPKDHGRCESFVQFYRNRAEVKPNNVFLKKHKVFSISKTLKLSKMKDRRVSTKLICYQGSKNSEFQPKYSNDITLFQRQNE